MRKTNVILIFGPTGVGKSYLAIKLARELNGEIISADSSQIYKGMDIGTAKISKKEQGIIKHHLIDIKSPSDYFSAFDFRKKALILIDDISKKGKLPFVVGGTPFYFSALINGLFEEGEKDISIRKELCDLAEAKGSLFLHNKLSKIDKEAAAKIHPNNKKKLIRALEVFKATNKTISEQWKEHKQNKGNNNLSFITIGITAKRSLLYAALDKRCDTMIDSGLIDEVLSLKNMGYNETLPSMQAIGYRHFFSYLNKETGLEECVRLFKRDTRRLAKRQWSFLAKIENTNWFTNTQYEEIKDLIKLEIKNN